MSETSADTGWFEVGDSPVVRTQVRFRECADGSVDLDIAQTMRDPEGYLDQLKIEQAVAETVGWRDGAIIGRVPDALYFSSGLAEANRQGDTKFVKSFWNDPDHAKLRVKQGRV